MTARTWEVIHSYTDEPDYGRLDESLVRTVFVAHKFTPPSELESGFTSLDMSQGHLGPSAVTGIKGLRFLSGRLAEGASLALLRGLA